MRGSTRPTSSRTVLIWLLGLTAGIAAGATSLYLVAGAPQGRAAAPDVSASDR